MVCKTSSQSWPSDMFFLVPTPKTPCRFLPRAKAKVQTYRKKSMYFWLQSALKCILRFLLHRNKKDFERHPACVILTRFFSGSFAHNEKFQRISSRQERKVKNALQNNHNNTFFLVLNRQRPWAKFQRGITCNLHFSWPFHLHKFLYSHSILNSTYVSTCPWWCSHSIQVYAIPCEFVCTVDHILNRDRITEVKQQRAETNVSALITSALHTFIFHTETWKISFTHWTVATIPACVGHTSLHTFLTKHKQQMVLEEMHVLPTLKLGRAKHWLENHSCSGQQSGRLSLHSKPAKPPHRWVSESTK